MHCEFSLKHKMFSVHVQMLTNDTEKAHYNSQGTISQEHAVLHDSLRPMHVSANNDQAKYWEVST